MFEPLHPWAAHGCAATTKDDRFGFLSKVLDCHFEDRYNTSIPFKEFHQAQNLTLGDTLDTRGWSNQLGAIIGEIPLICVVFQIG